MRAIFLNIWQGQVWDKLQDFIESETSKTDIFSFVEVDPRVYKKLKEILPGYESVYGKFTKIKYLDGVYEGRAIFYKKGIKLLNDRAVKIYEPSDTEGGGLHFAELEVDGKRLFVGVVHGISKPGDKLDSKERLKQSEIIIDTFKGKSPVIIGGDFNLFPKTKSVQMFEEAGYRNLIKDFNIKNTRNKISWKMYDNIQHFADYCFVSKDVRALGFAVPNIEVSDHEPLILDFEV
jgi:endonuclease/exonuclease/phosphatase family metal-dependent hydrolase